MNHYLLDASAWIEYLDGGESAIKVKEVLEKGKCQTAIVTLAETISKIERMGLNSEVAIDAILEKSTIISCLMETGIKAGKIHSLKRKTQPNFSLADSFILAQREKNQIIVTKDLHFHEEENVQFI